MGLPELKADIELNLKSLEGGADPVFALKELWAWNASLIEELEIQQGELMSQGDAIDELIETTADVIHPELAGKIHTALALGHAIAEEYKRLVDVSDDDLLKKKAPELLKQYAIACQVVSTDVQEATLPLPGYEDDDDPDPDDPEVKDPEDESSPEVEGVPLPTVAATADEANLSFVESDDAVDAALEEAGI